jgi:hypothetical protein
MGFAVLSLLCTEQAPVAELRLFLICLSHGGCLRHVKTTVTNYHDVNPHFYADILGELEPDIDNN